MPHKNLMLKSGIWTSKIIKKELDLIKQIYNENWERNWGFVPLTNEEIDAMADDLKQLATPSPAFFLEINGKPVGFSLTILDYNQIFKQMNGRLSRLIASKC
ncbi:MAG: hypothetical protein IPG53_18720 [Ignavibacteriales bacterium]|nr:hypothetical protein [Ignavibacteriales bacterium]